MNVNNIDSLDYLRGSVIGMFLSVDQNIWSVGRPKHGIRTHLIRICHIANGDGYLETRQVGLCGKHLLRKNRRVKDPIEQRLRSKLQHSSNKFSLWVRVQSSEESIPPPFPQIVAVESELFSESDCLHSHKSYPKPTQMRACTPTPARHAASITSSLKRPRILVQKANL